jgi:hypothetical protein
LPGKVEQMEGIIKRLGRSRHAMVLAWAIASTAGSACGIALDATGQAPQECGFDGVAIMWSGAGSLNELGFDAPPEFPRHRLADVFVTAEPMDGPFRAYCARLPDGGFQNGPWWIVGDVPDGWDPPGQR